MRLVRAEVQCAPVRRTLFEYWGVNGMSKSSRRYAALAGALVVAACAMPALATSATAATGKVGPQVAGVGIGSQAALAEQTCDAATKRTNYSAAGTGPLCVNPWPEGKDNGGATAPGVTKDSVKVVVYYGNEAMADAERAAGGRLPVDQTTGQPGTWPDNFRDFDEVVQYANKNFGTYQTWGRKPAYEFVEASGPDEAAQRADAVKVVAMKPFIVIDASNQNKGAPVFEAEMAKAKIIVNGAAASALTTEEIQKQAPYRWATQADTTASVYLVANFLSNALSGKKARWAGDDKLASKQRAFGLVTPEGVVDVDLFNSLMKKYGGSKPVEAITYDPNADATQVDEVAKTLVAKLQQKGVTTVVLFANNTAAKSLTTAATANDFNPEWIVTGFQFQDFDGFARTYDQQQWAHAFGVGVLPPQAIPDPNAAAAARAVRVVLGQVQGHVRGDDGRLDVVHLRRHAVRGTEAHRRQRAEGSVLGARHGRRVERHRFVPDRLRADGRAPVRRVPRARHRRGDGLVEPHPRDRWHERGRELQGHGPLHVPERRQALLVRGVPEVRAPVLRRVGLDLPVPAGPGLRDGAGARDDALHGLPEPGWNGSLTLVRGTENH